MLDSTVRNIASTMSPSFTSAVWVTAISVGNPGVTRGFYCSSRYIHCTFINWNLSSSPQLPSTWFTFHHLYQSQSADMLIKFGLVPPLTWAHRANDLVLSKVKAHQYKHTGRPLAFLVYWFMFTKPDLNICKSKLYACLEREAPQGTRARHLSRGLAFCPEYEKGKIR